MVAAVVTVVTLTSFFGLVRGGVAVAVRGDAAASGSVSGAGNISQSCATMSGSSGGDFSATTLLTTDLASKVIRATPSSPV